MAKKRKAREKTDDINLMKPIDITKFGSDDDPCFGKLYNLSAEECRRCGDQELCSIVFGQGLHLKRKEVEKETRFKDIEIAPKNESLIKWVKEKHKEGLSRSEVIKKARNTFGSSRDDIKTIYKNLKLK